MKPLYLEMDGYGPYAKKTEIDFNKLPDNLTLISGNTGAGKTTIFDAICCALFGESSGKGRSFKQMRSDFETDNKPTKITFKFKVKDQEYEITRYAPYDKKKKDSEETTKVNAKAELVLPDETVVTGMKNVNEYVKEILGIGQDEFRQIVMIAQNDFMAMIKGAGKEQEKIFNDIFNASLYENFARKILVKYKEYLQKTEIDADKIISALSSAGLDTESLEIEQSNININKLKEFVSKTKEETEDRLKKANQELEKEKSVLRGIEVKRISASRLIEQFHNRADLDQSLKQLLLKQDDIKKLEAKKEWATKARDIVETPYRNYQRVSESFHNLEETKELKEKELSQKKNIYQKKCEILNQYAQDKLNDLYRNYKKLSDELPKYEELSNLNLIISKSKKEENSLKAKLQKTEESLTKAKKENESLDIRPDEFFKAEEDRLKLKLKAAEEGILEIKSYLNVYNTIAQLLASLKKDRKGLIKLNESSVRAKDKYNEAFKNYISNQAAFLAQDLKKGEPCPVCGSREHPKLATFTSKSVTKEELDRLKKDEERKEKSLREESERFNSQRQNFEFNLDKLKNSVNKLELSETEREIFDSHLSQLNSFGEKLDQGQDISSFTINSENLQKLIQNLSNQKILESQKIENDLERNKKAFNLNNQLKKRLEILKKEILRLEKQTREAQEGLRDKREKIIEIQTRLKTLIDECKYSSLAEAQKECNILKSKYEDYKKDFNQAREQKEEAGKSLDSLNGELKNLESQLTDTETELKLNREAFDLSLRKGGFETEDTFFDLRLEPEEIKKLTKKIDNYNNQRIQLKAKKRELDKSLENSATRF